MSHTDIFYAHLVPLDDALTRLNQFSLGQDEQEQLENLVSSLFHHRVLDAIFENIPVEHHDAIVQHIAADPTDLGIIIFLKQQNPEIEEHITQNGKQLYDELHALFHGAQLG